MRDCDECNADMDELEYFCDGCEKWIARHMNPLNFELLNLGNVGAENSVVRRERIKNMKNPINFIGALFVALLMIALPVFTVLSLFYVDAVWVKCILIISTIVEAYSIFKFILILITTDIVRVRKE